MDNRIVYFDTFVGSGGLDLGLITTKLFLQMNPKYYTTGFCWSYKLADCDRDVGIIRKSDRRNIYKIKPMRSG